MSDQPLSQQIRRAGVMGWPVEHSLSPRVHGYWLRHYGIAGKYVRIPVTPEDLTSKLRTLDADGFKGVNITVPHKQAALANVDEVHPFAKRIGALNTVVLRDDGTLYGFNTDGFGFLENLRQSVIDFDPTHGPAVVFGAGGAARAIVATLLEAGAPEVRILNRTLEHAERLVADLTQAGEGALVIAPWKNRDDSLDGAALLVNTTILGMTGQYPLEVKLDALPVQAVVNDIVYAPLETDLLRRARARTNPAVDGLGMLLHQARPGFEAWFGRMPEVTPELRRYVLAGT